MSAFATAPRRCDASALEESDSLFTAVEGVSLPTALGRGGEFSWAREVLHDSLGRNEGSRPERVSPGGYVVRKWEGALSRDEEVGGCPALLVRIQHGGAGAQASARAALVVI